MAGHYLILGGGLAGSFMAARLCLAGQRVTLIDDRDSHSASRTAAGLFNVITGRFGAKSWLADTLLAEIKQFLAIPSFQELARFVHYSSIYRPFKTTEDYNKWLGKVEDPAYQALVDFVEKPLHEDLLINPMGGVMIKPCGWVDTAGLIDGLLHALEFGFHLRRLTGHIDYDSIDIENRTVQLRQEALPFDHIVCCEGYQMVDNPWFEEVRLIPNKGEILRLEIPGLELPFVVSKKIYLIPEPTGSWVCGATYANDFQSLEPTPSGREEIESYLHKTIKLPYKITGHWSGVRPTTPNRRPVLGTHPELPHLHVLNGFGTKGVLLAPYCSRIMAEGLINGNWDIPKEAQLNRFYVD